MAWIRFDNFAVDNARRITFDYSKAGSNGELYFEVSSPVPFDGDSLAICLSTLIAKKYSDVHASLKVSPQVAQAVRSFTGANVTFDAENETAMKGQRNGHILNFSGGFDSLATLQLMPPGTNLVSMDFGGKFRAERDFFTQFNTVSVSTNITGTEFQTNSWSMMGIGSILLSPVFRSKFITFGSIAGASPETLSSNPAAARVDTFPPFAGAGYINAGYSLGMTEVATAMLIAKYEPQLIQPSLESLAPPGSTKRYRKAVLAELACRRLNVDANIENPTPPVYPHKWGTYFAADLAGLYILKHAGRDAFENLVTGAPESVHELCERLSLRFYERINTTQMTRFPAELWGGMLAKAAPARVTPYDEHDWTELQEVRKVLGTNFPSINQ